MSAATLGMFFVDLDIRLIEAGDDRALKELILAGHLAAPTASVESMLGAFDAAAGDRGYGIITRFDLRLIVCSAHAAYRKWGWNRERAHRLATLALGESNLLHPHTSSFGPRWSTASLWDFLNFEPYSLPSVIRTLAAELIETDARIADALEAARYAAARLKGLA